MTNSSLRKVLSNWQARRDLNPDKQYQKLLCYHYTTGLQRTQQIDLSRWRQGMNIR